MFNFCLDSKRLFIRFKIQIQVELCPLLVIIESSLLKTMWNTSLPFYPDPVGIENCKQLFSQLLAFTTQKIATHSTDIISAVCVAFFGS